MPDATGVAVDAGFGRADLTAFCRLDALGLEVTGQRLESDRAVLACRVVEPADSDERWCRRCGCEGAPRDSVVRRLAHEPFGWRPTVLLVTVRRYRCAQCGHVWRQDTSRAVEPRARLSRRGLRWALEGIVVAHLSVARVAEGLGVSWNTANDAVLAEGKRILIDDPARFDVITEPFAGEFQTGHYVYQWPDRPFEPVTLMRVRVRITDPAETTTMPAGAYTIRGKAWSGAGPITEVGLSFTGESEWSPAVVESDTATTPSR